jgi:hypothetical protein
VTDVVSVQDLNEAFHRGLHRQALAVAEALEPDAEQPGCELCQTVRAALLDHAARIEEHYP